MVWPWVTLDVSEQSLPYEKRTIGMCNTIHRQHFTGKRSGSKGFSFGRCASVISTWVTMGDTVTVGTLDAPKGAAHASRLLLPHRQQSTRSKARSKGMTHI